MAASSSVALVTLSAACAFLFGTHLAPGLEGVLYGSLGVAGDILKAMLPFAIVAAARSLHMLRALAGLALFLAVSAYSFTSEIGLYALSREATSAIEREGRDAYDAARTHASEAAARLNGFGTVRPLAAIEADLAAAQFDKAWVTSKACTDATAKTSREFCATVARLEGERGSAIAHAKAREEADDARVAFEGLTARPSAARPTPSRRRSPGSPALPRIGSSTRWRSCSPSSSNSAPGSAPGSCSGVRASHGPVVAALPRRSRAGRTTGLPGRRTSRRPNRRIALSRRRRRSLAVSRTGRRHSTMPAQHVPPSQGRRHSGRWCWRPCRRSPGFRRGTRR